MHVTESPLRWQLPRVTSWWAPTRPARGLPSIEDSIAVELILTYLARHAGLGALEARWLAEPPRRRTLQCSGLRRSTDGAAGSVSFRLGVSAQGVTGPAAARSVADIEAAIGEIFEAGAHDAVPSPAPEALPVAHAVQLLSAPSLSEPSWEDLVDLPGLLARCAIRGGPLTLEARVAPMADSEALLREANELHRKVLARDGQRFVRPSRANWRRSLALRGIQDMFLLELHLRAHQPLHPAVRLLLARYVSSRLALPVEIGEAGAAAPRTPVDSSMAGAILGSCLHAFAQVRRGSAAQELAAASDAPQRQARRMLPLGDEDEELWPPEE